MGASELPLKKAYEPFTSVRKHGEVRIQKVRQHDERQIKNAATLVKNLFNKTFTGTSEKELAELITQAIKEWHDDLKSFNSKAQTGHFPGKQTIQQGIILLADLLQQSNSFLLIERCLEQSKALEDFAEDFEDLDDFYNSQFQTWQNLSKTLNDQFKANRPFLEKDPTAQKALDELDRIYGMPSPYDQLRYINPLIEKVQNINEHLVSEKRQLVQAQIDHRIERVLAALTQVHAPDELRNKALHPLQQCKKHIDSTDSIPQIISEQLEAETHEAEAEHLINKHIESLRQKEISKAGDSTTPSTGNKVSEPKPKKTVTVSPLEVMVSQSKTGFIETEADVEQYLNQLRNKLLNAIKDGDRVRIK
jgi:hypothetical protein